MKTSLDIYNEFMEMAPEIANDWAQVQSEIGCPEDEITHDEYWGDCFKQYAHKHYDWTLGDSIIKAYFPKWIPVEERVVSDCFDYDDSPELIDVYERYQNHLIPSQRYGYEHKIINRRYYPHFNINQRAKHMDSTWEQSWKTAFIKDQHADLPF